MNVRMKQNIVYILIISMLIASVFKVISKVTDGNIWKSEKEVELKSDEDKSLSKDKEENVKAIVEESPLRLYKMGEIVKFGDFSYKVSSVRYQKNIDDFPAPTNWESCKYDEEGNIIGEYSYIIVTVSITNDELESQEIYLNSMNLIVLRNQETRVGDYSECVSASKIEGYGRKDFFRVKLNPAQEYEYDLVFIAPDTSIANNEAQLIITRVGEYTASNNDDKFRCIEITFK